MTNQKPFLLLGALLFFFALSAAAQSRSSSFNKDSRQPMQRDWSFGGDVTGIFSLGDKEMQCFRGNSVGSKIFGSYNFGNIGLGLSAGVLPGNLSNAAINEFLVVRKLQQATVIQSNPFNSFLLFGPSIQFGKTVAVTAELQGGFCLNNPGSVTVTQPGTIRTLYEFKPGPKNIFPGFSGNIKLAYPITASTRFVIQTGYLQTTSSILLLDPQQGIDVATEQQRKLRLMTVGLGLTKIFKPVPSNSVTSRSKEIIAFAQDPVSGANGKTTSNGVLLESQQKHAINTKGTGANNGRVMSPESCGAVTVKTTHPDGTIEERIFACPSDAVGYEDRKNVTVPKQTQGTTFGEKVNAGLHAAGSALGQGASRAVLSGTVSWSTHNSNGIVTNQEAVSSVGNLTGSSAGAAQASYAKIAATGTPGVLTNLYLKDAGSERTSGKKPARKSSNELLITENKYIPLFSETGNTDCPGCAATVKLIAQDLAETVQHSSALATKSPLHTGGGSVGSNPLFEQKNKTTNSSGNACDGIGGLSVYLLNTEDGRIAATTNTDNCGHFYFANVPPAQYVVQISGAVNHLKSYDVNVSSDGKLDVGGEVKTGNDHWVIKLNTGTHTAGDGVSSNAAASGPQGRSITLIESDNDGNGSLDLTRAILEFTDGSVEDVTAYTRILNVPGSKKVTVRGWDVGKKQLAAAPANAATEYTLDFATDMSHATMSSNSNNVKKEMQVSPTVSNHGNVVQWTVPLPDQNAPGSASSIIKTRTKSNNSNDRASSGQMVNANINMGHVIKEMPVFASAPEGDGSAKVLVGSTHANKVYSGATAGGSAAMAGEPIPGINVKLGKNPGGSSLQTTQSNSNGAFEFTNLQKGNYILTTNTYYYIDDQTLVTVGDVEDQDRAYRKGWDGTVKGGSKTQDHSLSKTNETGDAGFVETDNASMNFLASLNELDELLNADKTSPAKALLNAKDESQKLRDLMRDSGNLGAAADKRFAQLINAIKPLGSSYNPISLVLKTKHDTAKNSVGNIR